ncbi:MAG TPA: helix-turn-helix domain-containing protein [Prolixibacteraceae bacterium]|nr:helix-turn-helix domain-containing protein [Prolixibacteraceae bacterium]
MDQKFVLPSPSVRPLIYNYLFLKKDEKESTINERFVPNGFVSIVFHFSPVESNVYINEDEILPGFFLVIPNVKPVPVSVVQLVDTMIVFCNASVLSALFHLKLKTAKDASHVVADLFGGFPMHQRLWELKTDEERIDFFESYLTANYDLAGYLPDEADRVYQQVIDSEGNLSIDGVIESLNTNYRTFRRTFHERTGISLKGLARIMRVNYIWRMISQNKDIDLQSIVCMCDYYDQSHLIHDFEKIVGESPKRFFNRDLENAKMISGVEF